ncbi:MAG TPA: Holliday junction resolvase RuvX [Anaerovoracaceae bacterium]|nr:Holliday junction resolvase RuvX [Anaerovoracaceae bacterium]
MKKIALDVGDKTIGIALSDDLLYTGQGLMTIQRVGIRKDAGKIIDMVREHKCDTIVVGLPKRLDGTDSPQTEKVYEFKNMLENKLLSLGMSKEVKIVYQDERLTTVIAEKVLIEADVSRKKRKLVIDKQAAVLIMQGYLDKLDYERRNK